MKLKCKKDFHPILSYDELVSELKSFFQIESGDKKKSDKVNKTKRVPDNEEVKRLNDLMKYCVIEEKKVIRRNKEDIELLFGNIENYSNIKSALCQLNDSEKEMFESYYEELVDHIKDLKKVDLSYDSNNKIEEDSFVKLRDMLKKITGTLATRFVYNINEKIQGSEKNNINEYIDLINTVNTYLGEIGVYTQLLEADYKEKDVNDNFAPKPPVVPTDDEKFDKKIIELKSLPYLLKYETDKLKMKQIILVKGQVTVYSSKVKNTERIGL